MNPPAGIAKLQLAEVSPLDAASAANPKELGYGG
jgi:hypothetical protein